MEPKSGGLEDDFLFDRVEFLGGSVSFSAPTLNHSFHATAAKTPLASLQNASFKMATKMSYDYNSKSATGKMFKNWPMASWAMICSVFCCQLFNLELPLFSQPIGTFSQSKLGPKRSHRDHGFPLLELRPSPDGWPTFLGGNVDV